MHFRQRLNLFIAILILTSATAEFGRAAENDAPDYDKQIAPLLRKYCAGCHNEEDREGGLALDSYAAMLRGGENGAAVIASHSELSRLYRVLTGAAKPAMPPEGEARPTEQEIAALKLWIDAGAKGPAGGAPDPTILVTPKVKLLADPREAVNAIAVSSRGDVATARYGEVSLTRLGDESRNIKLQNLRGNVNAVAFSRDGSLMVTAAGEAGLFGEAQVWNVADGTMIGSFVGHKDSLYAVQLSPDNKLLATAGYDQTIKLWDVADRKELRTLSGHNGAIYDLAFHPEGKILASCSADRTVKLWDIADGARLDTLGQSTQELYTVAFQPDGKRLAAAGVDNRIRVWRISKSGKEGTNPLLFSRFAHESPVLRVAYSIDGRTLFSTGEDHLIKIWNARPMTLRATFEAQPDWVTGLAVAADDKTLLIGCLDGTSARHDISEAAREAVDNVKPVAADLATDVEPGASADMTAVTESEPNDQPDSATSISVPASVTGTITEHGETLESDVDIFRFDAKAGEQWVVETNAARSGSPLDSKIEVLHADGRPVQRLLLRAVRDSEITFRGVDSDQLQCRVVNWEEMELNEYLYINGEVCKLYQAPRGPDSGFQFYPNTGKRHGYFDTSALTHPLGQACYIVQPFWPGTRLPDNGLPLFPVYFENDDDALRRWDKDSQLTFAAPADGTYLVRVRDVRGFAGADFKYTLTIRRPQPDFKVTLAGANPTVNAGSGKAFSLKAERIDNFDGPITIDITGLPPGFTATTPITIEAGHIAADGVINAHANAPQPTEANWSQTEIVATAQIGEAEIQHEVNNLGTIKLANKPKLVAYVEPTDEPVTSGDTPQEGDLHFAPPPEISIEPGTSTTCRLRIERNGFEGRVEFDVNNLPHGVIVDDIGLNGVLIPEGQTERVIFLTAAKWVPASSRAFYAAAKAEGNQASMPMILHVRPADNIASEDSR